MLATGKITADEAERLIAALETAEKKDDGSPSRTGKPRYLRVVVDDTDHRVNVRVPMKLIRAGIKLSALIPQQAVDAAKEESGIDLSQINRESRRDRRQPRGPHRRHRRQGEGPGVLRVTSGCQALIHGGKLMKLQQKIIVAVLIGVRSPSWAVDDREPARMALHQNPTCRGHGDRGSRWPGGRHQRIDHSTLASHRPVCHRVGGGCPMKPGITSLIALAIALLGVVGTSAAEDPAADSMALIIVDIQEFYFEGGFAPLVGSVEAAKTAQQVLEHFRANNSPVIHVPTSSGRHRHTWTER